MAPPDDTCVKIRFRFFSDALEAWTVETLWARPVDARNGLYKIDNIPFYAPVASDDVVFAEYDADEHQLTYRETVQPSGNSTVQVVIMDGAIVVQDLRDAFSALGCSSERFSNAYFVLEIPAGVDYGPIRQQLASLEAQGVIGYAEPVLSSNHRY